MIIYDMGVAISKPLLNIYNKIRVENLPKPFPEGKLIISGNHTCWADPFWISSVVPRQVRYLAKEELFKNALFKSLFTGAGAHPVKRGAPDRKAIKFMIDSLNNNEIIGIFPEGTRNKEKIGEAHNGAAYIALKTGSPILPVSIYTRGLKFRSEIVLKFQNIINVQQEKKISKERLNQLTSQIMTEIASGLDR